MRPFRRSVPVLAALLVVLVAVQATDLVACADEAQAAEHTETHTDGPRAQGAHEAPAPGNSHGGHESEPAPDCLCHVVFVPTGVVPALSAGPATEARRTAVAVVAPPEVEPLGLDPVPLA